MVRGSDTSAQVNVQVVSASPRLIADPAGRAQVLRASGLPLGDCERGPFGTPLCPGVTPGEAISFFATGLGPVSNPPEDGRRASFSPVVDPTTVSVTIGGIAAQVLWTGLAPGLVGVYQLNARVPPHAPVGNQQVRVTVDGRISGPATLNVRVP